MRKTLELKNAIPIDGKIVNQVDYDPDEITIELFEEACKETASPTVTREANDRMHINLFWAAVMAINDNIVDFSGVNNIKGMHDIVNAADIGRRFLIGLEDSDENEDSGQHLETTAETSMSGSENCEGVL